MGKNIVLIGMPGTGKTTIGKEVSNCTGLKYLDTDDLVKNRCSMELKDFVALNGSEAFMSLQRNVISEILDKDYVIATGGSVVQDSETMEHLNKIGEIVYLETPFEVLEERLAPDRKLARKNGESFKDLFNKREVLYRKYSKYIIDCSSKDLTAITQEVCKIFNIEEESNAR